VDADVLIARMQSGVMFDYGADVPTRASFHFRALAPANFAGHPGADRLIWVAANGRNQSLAQFIFHQPSTTNHTTLTINFATLRLLSPSKRKKLQRKAAPNHRPRPGRIG